MLSDHPSSTSNQEHAQLLKALRESEILRELSELLASSLDPTRILQVLVKRTTEVCEVERCAVWLLDEEHASLIPSAYHFSTQHVKQKVVQLADHMWHHSSIPSSNPVFQRLLATQGVLTLEDLRSEPSMRKIAEKFFVRSVLLIALIREDRPVGMMALDNHNTTRTFTTGQQQLARAIGQQAAVAIDNARLYQQAQIERQRAERLIERAQAIYQVAQAVNAGTDLPKVLRMAAHHLTEGAGAQNAAITLLTHRTLSLAHTTALSPLPESDVDFQLAELPHCTNAARYGEPLFVSWQQLNEAEKRWFQLSGMSNILIVPLMLGTQQDQSARRQGAATTLPPQQCVGFAFLHYPLPAPAPKQENLTFAREIAAQCALAIEKARMLDEMQQAVLLATERANTLDAIFNAMTEGIVVLDLEGRVIANNNTALSFTSIVPNMKTHLEAYLKYHPASTLYGQPLPLDDHPLIRALRGEPIRGERMLSIQGDGLEHAIEVNIAPLLDSDRQQIGIVSAFRDITEQVRVEQHIRHALDTMLHAAEVVSGVSDLRTITGRVLAMTLGALNCERGVALLYHPEDQSFTPLLSIGFDLEEADLWLAEQPCWTNPTEPAYAEFYGQLLEGNATLLKLPQGTTAEISSPVLAAPIIHNHHLLGVLLLDRSPAVRWGSTQPGATRPLGALAFSTWDMAVVEGIAQFAGLAIEQTRLQQEAEIAHLNEETMRESNELKDEFLAITAHEFRTPLTVILAHSQMMGRILQKALDVNTELKERLDESRSFIEDQTRQLTQIVNSFLEVTQLNRGQLTLVIEEFNLEEIVTELIAHHQATLTNHELSSCIKPSNTPYLLKGDRARIRQILANLVQNAIKYSPLGGPITVTLEHCIDSNGGMQIAVTVEDHGIGVPREAQPYLFERFYRVPGIKSAQTRGVGLGLYLVAEFLHLHNGTIRVESSGIEGEGSRFIFTLPALSTASR